MPLSAADMTIRPYVEADEQAVISLWERCGLTRPWNDPRKDIARKLAVQRELFLVGTIDGRIVAAVMGGYEGHRGWVNYLAVDPVLRLRGLGRAMMTAIEARLAALGCPKINLQVRVGNNEGAAFYQHIGYAQDAVLSFGRRLIGDEPAG